jgi:tellurite resistance protein
MGVLGKIFNFLGGGDERARARLSPFTLRMRRETIKGIDCFVAEIGGTLLFPVPDAPHKIALHILDVTDDEDGDPVICEIPDLQEADTPVFSFQTKTRKTPPVGYSISVRGALCAIPILALALPRSGMRTLHFRADVIYAAAGPTYIMGRIAAGEERIIVSAACETELQNIQPGYKEYRERRERFEDATVHLAIAVGFADGKFEERERWLVGRWIQKTAAAYGEGERKEASERLSETYFGAKKRVLSEPLRAARNAAHALRDAPEALKIAALELCVQVAGADNEAAASENRMLNFAAKEMESDMARFRALCDRHLPAPAEEDADIESLLGIRAEMDRLEINKLLLREFNKWNRRTANPDAKIRAKSELMLKLIAEARKKYGKK